MKRLFLALTVCLVAATSIARAQDLTVTLLAAGTDDSALVAPSSDSRYRILFCGFSARETGGAAASIASIYAGTSAAGRLLFTFSLSLSESRSEGPWLSQQCLPAAEGIFIDRAGTGTTLLLLYTREVLFY